MTVLKAINDFCQKKNKLIFMQYKKQYYSFHFFDIIIPYC